MKRAEENKEYNRAFVRSTIEEDEKLTSNPYSKGEHTFKDISEAFALPEFRENSLKRARKELESFEHKYNQVPELKFVIEAMHAFLNKK